MKQKSICEFISIWLSRKEQAYTLKQSVVLLLYVKLMVRTEMDVGWNCVWKELALNLIYDSCFTHASYSMLQWASEEHANFSTELWGSSIWACYLIETSSHNLCMWSKATWRAFRSSHINLKPWNQAIEKCICSLKSIGQVSCDNSLGFQCFSVEDFTHSSVIHNYIKWWIYMCKWAQRFVLLEGISQGGISEKAVSLQTRGNGAKLMMEIFICVFSTCYWPFRRIGENKLDDQT